MFARLAQSGARQAEILEVVLRHGWDYMRRLLSFGKAGEPQLPPPMVLRNILVDLGPVYVKLGQLLSTRPDLLPREYIEALSTLQADVPPVPWNAVEILLRQQLRQPLEQVFSSLDTESVAAGSIAQVHRACLVSGEWVALKIQRPGLEAVVERDTRLIRGIAELVAQTEFGRLADVVALADEFCRAIQAELDFTQEARHTEQLRQQLQRGRWFDPAQLVVPRIHWPLTTPKVLTLEWIEGRPLLEADRSDADPENIARLLTRAFFQQICIDGYFHADPHPGNLFYLGSGRVALLDCGMIGRLDPRTQQILLELMLAIVSLDAQRCAELTLELALPERSAARSRDQTVSLAQLQSDYERLLRQYYALSIAELNFSQLFSEILQAARRNQIRIPGNLGLCAKALANLEGIARQLTPDYNLPEQLRPLMADVFRAQLLGEAPLPSLLRTALDLKNLSLQSPRQMELLLSRITSETQRWNLTIQELDGIRSSLDQSANRLSYSIVVGSLIVGAAIISAQTQRFQVFWLSELLFGAASLLGLWLVISILRSGRLRG
ncbi:MULTISPECIES: ABC1 kinase family protein [unclassified Synechococcus]|jgi:ubiquinone biosynthesis protein|uniref:ABC1 kinase family protein n=1 Tax=unclassified Synechococcus TaxID=2626047 RepID=UPI00006949F7|nr:AarF/ABC1/UbiB kinase family protein [Synechococcus sp. JA-2-3B'a(2-13)]ABD01142.1 ABC1 domain protein [Synechococcus sp. JA-2-3B'a(2-13)]